MCISVWGTQHLIKAPNTKVKLAIRLFRCLCKANTGTKSTKGKSTFQLCSIFQCCLHVCEHIICTLMNITLCADFCQITWKKKPHNSPSGTSFDLFLARWRQPISPGTWPAGNRLSRVGPHTTCQLHSQTQNFYGKTEHQKLCKGAHVWATGIHATVKMINFSLWNNGRIECWMPLGCWLVSNQAVEGDCDVALKKIGGVLTVTGFRCKTEGKTLNYTLGHMNIDITIPHRCQPTCLSDI